MLRTGARAAVMLRGSLPSRAAFVVSALDPTVLKSVIMGVLPSLYAFTRPENSDGVVQLQSAVARLTDCRLTRTQSSPRGLVEFHLIHQPAAERVIRTFPQLFPLAQERPREWLARAARGTGEGSSFTPLQNGLLSGFPPDAVHAFERRKWLLDFAGVQLVPPRATARDRNSFDRLSLELRAERREHEPALRALLSKAGMRADQVEEICGPTFKASVGGMPFKAFDEADVRWSEAVNRLRDEGISSAFES